MNTLPTWFFGGFVLVFVVGSGLALLWSPGNARTKKLVFAALHLASLVFALALIAGQWPHAESKFIEIGYYYPLDASAGSGNAAARPYAVSLGDTSQQPDYIIDKECVRQPCFRGRVELKFEAKAGAPNLLTWESRGLVGAVSVRRAPEGAWAVTKDWVLGWMPAWTGLRRDQLDGAKGVELQGEVSRLYVVWTPPPSEPARARVELPVTIELNQGDAPPRIIVERQVPRTIELPSARNLGEGGAAGPSPTVYVTSLGQPVAVRSADGRAYAPTITVGDLDPRASVKAHIERPVEEEQGFILNTGLSRTGNQFGERVFVGSERGVVATVIASDGGASRFRYVVACIALWLLPLWFFLPLSQRAQLYALLPAVQMLLAVRLVLGVRTYLWSPYSRETVEGAVLACVLVPLLVFIGCYAVGLHRAGSARESERLPWLRSIYEHFPPAVYYAASVVLFVALWVWLAPGQLTFIRADVLAFGGLSNALRPLALLMLLPVLVCAVALLIDQGLRRGAARDMDYAREPADPITYRITKPVESWPEDQGWSRACTWYLIRALVGGAVVVVLWGLGRYFSDVAWRQALVWLAAGVVGLLESVILRRLAAVLRPVSRTAHMALRSLYWIVLGASLLWLFKGAWNLTLHPLGLTRAVPDALLPYVPLRTNAFFQFVILILTIRLLAAFFTHWRDADVQVRVWSLVIVFAAPVLMFGTSILASHDTGALLVHGPAMIGATLLVTGLWPLWKSAAGRRHALGAILLMFAVLSVYALVAYTTATKLVITDPQSTFAQRTLLIQGTEAAMRSADVGGPGLLGAIEQNWRMMDYAAEGGWTGVGYGNAPVPPSRTFQSITLSDLVFSVYVLAEHGALGGLALLALYLLILLAALRVGWDTVRHEPLRLALVVGLALMVVFPALYMMAANLNEGIFTGQDLPLLGLRSQSDVARTGVALMLLLAALNVLGERREYLPASPGWWQLIRHNFALAMLGRRAKALRLRSLGFDPWTAAAATATNIGLVAVLIIIAAFFPVFGVIHASGNEDYKKDLDLADLRERAEKFIANQQVWYEPVQQGAKVGSCRGGEARNTPAPAGADPAAAYQLCIDDNLRGANEGGTFAWWIDQWNAGRGRESRRGNGTTDKTSYDDRQFFQLDTTLIGRGMKAGERRVQPLRVNPGIYRQACPFRPQNGWTGSLVEASAAGSDGGALVGAGVVMPLRAAGAEERPVFVGTNPGHVNVDLSRPQRYNPERGFAVFDPKDRKVIFRVETVSGAQGALLQPEKGDFNLYLNGCPVVVGSGDDCRIPEAVADAAAVERTAPRLRLDDGDIIAYAPSDGSGKKPVPRYVFVYSRVQLGAFSYIAWVDGRVERFYPQAETWPMARDIVRAIVSSSPAGEASRKDVALTIDSNLNDDAYDLLRQWRAQLERDRPVRTGTRKMSLTLLDPNTGEVLALASDYGSPEPVGGAGASARENLNLVRHRVGSVIKPFTASAALRAFPNLYQMTVVDRRRDQAKVFGLPLGNNGKVIRGHDGATEIPWERFLPYSDNLYAVTLSLLGMSAAGGPSGLPPFAGGQAASAPLRLELTDAARSNWTPQWAEPNMFDAEGNRVELLERTPLARQLAELFDTVTGAPQVSSYDAGMWAPLEKQGLMSKRSSFNFVSPQITNFALADVRNFVELRAVLLGGEFEDLSDYGSVGSAWSNVYLAQSFARITTGKRVRARIVADTDARGPAEPWFEGAEQAPWRDMVMHGLRGVVALPGATAHEALSQTVEKIGRGATGQRRFAIFSKTGTLDSDDRGGKLEDSVYVFTAGMWDEASRSFERPVTAAIYIEQGTQGQAQLLAADLLKLLNESPRFKWSQP